MKNLLLAFVRNDDGATAIEYALVSACIAAAMMAIWPDFYNDYMTAMVNIGNTITSKTK